MKRFSLDEPEHFVDEYIPPKMKEDPQGNYVLHSDFEKAVEALKSAKWFNDHIMGKEKRVDWGKTFDINWMGVNEHLIKIEKTLKELGV